MIIYPNPTTGQFTIEFEKQSENKISIFNTLGNIVHERVVYEKSALINLELLQNGIYTVKSQNIKGIIIKKIIIQSK